MQHIDLVYRDRGKFLKPPDEPDAGLDQVAPGPMGRAHKYRATVGNSTSDEGIHVDHNRIMRGGELETTQI